MKVSVDRFLLCDWLIMCLTKHLCFDCWLHITVLYVHAISLNPTEYKVELAVTEIRKEQISYTLSICFAKHISYIDR